MKPADAVDAFAPFEDYVKARFADDPHVWAVVLYDEVVELGYPLAYATFTRHLRERKLRPHCEQCSRTAGRASAVIEHRPGDEVQWDWVGATRSRVWRVNSQIGGRRCRVRSS